MDTLINNINNVITNKLYKICNSNNEDKIRYLIDFYKYTNVHIVSMLHNSSIGLSNYISIESFLNGYTLRDIEEMFNYYNKDDSILFDEVISRLYEFIDNMNSNSTWYPMDCAFC